MPDVSYDNSHLIADDEGAFSSFLAGRQESMADILDSRRSEPEKPRGLALPENTCPALEPGPNAKLKCSDGNRSRSSCFLTCENGFRVVNKKVKLINAIFDKKIFSRRENLSERNQS